MARRSSAGAKVGLVLVGLLVVGWFVAGRWAGYAWAHVKAQAFPRDVALLAYFPDSAPFVAVVDPHLTDKASVGAEARARLERMRADVLEASGIDLVRDVDKIVVGQDLVVVRARYDAKELGDVLTARKYTLGEHAGLAYFVRPGDDALALAGDGLLVYGSEGAIKKAADANASGKTLLADASFVAALDEAGWRHALLARAVVDDRPVSLREAILSSGSLKALTFSVDTRGGVLDLTLSLEAPTQGAAEELQRMLEAARKKLADEGKGIEADIARGAVVTLDGAKPRVHVRLHVPVAQLEAEIREVEETKAAPEIAWLALFLSGLAGAPAAVPH